MLGAVLANRVKDLIISGLLDLGPAGADAAHRLQTGGSGTSVLDVRHLPAPVAAVVREAYGDATGRIFAIAAVCAVVSLITVLFIREVPLRRTVAKT